MTYPVSTPPQASKKPINWTIPTGILIGAGALILIILVAIFYVGPSTAGQNTSTTKSTTYSTAIVTQDTTLTGTATYTVTNTSTTSLATTTITLTTNFIYSVVLNRACESPRVCECKLLYTPQNNPGMQYVVDSPCSNTPTSCYTYIDSNGNQWQVCSFDATSYSTATP